MRKSYRNTAFLVELLICILIFSISCAILTGIFGKAGTLARNTREENYAAAEIHSIFETAKVRGTGAVAVDGLGEQVVSYYYDSNWVPAEQDAAEYRITLTVGIEVTSGGFLDRLSAVAEHRSGREICILETALYQQGEAKGGTENG